MQFTGRQCPDRRRRDGSNLTLTLSVTNGTLTHDDAGRSQLQRRRRHRRHDDDVLRDAGQPQHRAGVAASTRRPPTTTDAAALTFSTTDGVAAPVVKTIALTVTAVADIVNDTVTTNEDTTISFNAITGTNGASADNFEGTPSVTGVTQGANGGVSSMGNGTLMYSPSANFSGSDSFTYTVTSGGVTEVGTVNVTVAAVNDAPTLNAIADPAPILVGAGLQTVEPGRDRQGTRRPRADADGHGGLEQRRR